jgi:hypothetical protein
MLLVASRLQRLSVIRSSSGSQIISLPSSRSVSARAIRIRTATEAETEAMSAIVILNQAILNLLAAPFLIFR